MLKLMQRGEAIRASVNRDGARHLAVESVVQRDAVEIELNTSTGVVVSCEPSRRAVM